MKHSHLNKLHKGSLKQLESRLDTIYKNKSKLIRFLKKLAMPCEEYLLILATNIPDFVK